ncbi:unnamed protein product [Cylicocyclus nassatus]|uniref:Uncharacterized protein n=1 Tax=Cylicocyclus nassatus TaxID=53992 RepID=A0AA36MAG7_CYLNA|nr:unnamed protein product [Cylicocyclus nassatus]
MAPASELLEDFRKWNKGHPSLDDDKYCVLTAQSSTEFELGWQNEVCNLCSAGNYVCQMNACDTDNYCPPD